MGRTRRTTLLALISSVILPGQVLDQQEGPDWRDRNQSRRMPLPSTANEDPKLPNGKSQKDAIARQAHEQAIRDANDLLTVAQQLRDELQRAGNFVVPISSVKKTEEIEKLARRIRGRLKE